MVNKIINSKAKKAVIKEDNIAISALFFFI